MKPYYIQIFSMTDHAQPLNDRYKGPYVGVNAELQTSEVLKGVLYLASNIKASSGDFDPKIFESAPMVLAYRHTDTGVLSGTSESLIPIQTLPWTEMPGIEIQKIQANGSVNAKLWMQEMILPIGQVTRVHFGKTMVYLKNFGPTQSIEWTEKHLKLGPSQLHAEEVNQDLTIAPPTGSGFQVKQGQEIQH